MSAKILIVDDEPPIIDMLSYNLKRANYDVLVAYDGEQALAQAQKEQPDLIILDLMLPRVDGLEVCRTIRKERDVPIIMLTARREEIDRIAGLEMGADDYVVKPFSPQELVSRVRAVIRRTERTASQQGKQAQVESDRSLTFENLVIMYLVEQLAWQGTKSN